MPWNLGMLAVPEGRARAVSQLAVYATATYMFFLLGWLSLNYQYSVSAALSLAAGAVISARTEVDQKFQTVSGLAAGFLAMIAVAVAVGLFLTVTSIDPGSGDLVEHLLLCSWMFVTGLDWRRVRRLRIIPAVTGLPVVFVVLGADSSALALGLLWLGLALFSLWSLETDQRRAYHQPGSLSPGSGGPPLGRAGDLVSSVVLALVLGAFVASFASLPSCRPSFGPFGFDRGTGERREMSPDNSEPIDLYDMTTTGDRLGVNPSTGTGTTTIDGEPYSLSTDPSGRAQLENQLTGERLVLGVEGDDVVARDSQGRERARFPGAGGSTKGGGGDSGGGGGRGSSSGSGPGSGNGSGSGSDSGSGSGSSTGTGAETPDRKPPAWHLVLAASLIAASLALLVWWFRQDRGDPGRGPRSWAEEQMRVIDRFSRAHQVPRAPGQTIHVSLANLTTAVGADPRLGHVGDVLSEALFDRGEPSMAERLWVEQVIDDLVSSHPPPRRWRRSPPASAPTISGPVPPV